MQHPLKGKNLCFVLLYQSSKNNKKNPKLHSSWKNVSSKYTVQRHFKIASDLIPQCHCASFYSAEQSSKGTAKESTAAVLGIPRVCVAASMPAAVLCQAPARWEMLCLDPVGSNLSPIPPCPPFKSFGMESYGVLSLYWKPAGTKDFQRDGKGTTKTKQKKFYWDMSSEKDSYTSNLCH